MMVVGKSIEGFKAINSLTCFTRLSSPASPRILRESCKESWRSGTRSGNATTKKPGVVLAGDYDEASGDLWSGRQRSNAAGSFRRNTAIGGDNWPLHEYAKVDKHDFDRFGTQAATWESECVVPMQYLLNIMSMIPKEQKAGID